MDSCSGKEIGFEKKKSRAGIGLVRDFYVYVVVDLFFVQGVFYVKICVCVRLCQESNCMSFFGLSEDDRTRRCMASAC